MVPPDPHTEAQDDPMATQSNLAEEPTSLADLVRAQRTELGLGLRSLADRTAPAPGGKPLLNYQWINRLEKREPVTPPDADELQALARALEIPLRRAQAAAAWQFFGITTIYSSSGEARAMVADMELMTKEERRQIEQLVETFARRRRD